MLGSSVLDLGIGLAFVFFLVSVVCSAASEGVSRLLGLRTRTLEMWLRDKILSGDAELLNRLYAHPMIKSLAPGKGKPDAIPARTLMLALFDACVPGAQGKTTVTELREALEVAPKGAPLRETLLGLATAAENTMEGLRSNFENWFEAAETVMTRAYRRNMWRVSLFIGIVVAIALNVDTIAVATSLWREPTLRSSIAAAATAYTAQAMQAGDTLAVHRNVERAMRELAELNLPLGWHRSEPQPGHGGSLEPADWMQNPPAPGRGRGFLKFIGWLITAFAGAQGAPFWFDALRKLTQRK